MAVAEEAVAAAASTMDAAFEEKLKEGAEAFEFQAEVWYNAILYSNQPSGC